METLLDVKIELFLSKTGSVCPVLFLYIRYRNSICHPLTAIPVVPEHSTSLYMSNTFGIICDQTKWPPIHLSPDVCVPRIWTSIK